MQKLEKENQKLRDTVNDTQEKLEALEKENQGLRRKIRLVLVIVILLIAAILA